MPLANRNAPFGFVLFGQGGKQGVHRVRRRKAAGTAKALFSNDAYELLADGTVIACIAGEQEANGVVEGPELNEPLFGMESNELIAAADEGWIIGIEDPSAQFRVQVSGGFIEANIGDHCDVLHADGSTVLAQSRQAVDSGSLGAGNQFRVVDLLRSPADNDFGNFAVIVVSGLQMKE